MSSASDPKPVVTGYPAAPPPPAVGAAYATTGTAYSYSAPPPPSGGAAYPTAGTAYPYAAPPPHAALYYSSHYPNGSAPPAAPYGPPARPHTRFLSRLLAVAVAFFLLMGLATLILWLVLRPRLPAFAVSSASVSAFNLSTSQQVLSSDFDLSLSVRNPNHKMGIYYDSVAAAVFYGSDAITETSLPPFYQGKGNATTVRARLVAAAAYVDADVAKGISSDRGPGDGVVNFHVRVLAWVRFRAGAWRTRRHVMRVYCDDVPIGFKNGTATVGSLVGSPKQCEVDL
ncbi:NDR1/HIN1-like protein 10 [Phoenix dactylifera]|uniref:NDR1/HIN1-like protein 10 n=1 Tax=Phoenix dactylifera TaxID=42345 RepID=A0A8B9ALX3_PHODC|nr:NDR1/HIN1-like protein 10 [Phoenix dactylifera]XP_038986656.1 NDR1/HIN1-like protein 10 [Phoenix dactylifera]XP_038986657.1 NDR1/HIN1-like protein 10 [Phoenix dactylifera]